MNEPVFIACLGVLVYLSKSAAGKIFRFAGSLPEKSEFVFTASQRADKKGLDGMAERAAQAGEAWISHFDPAGLIKQLMENGFSHVAYLSPEEATRQYFANTRVVLPPPRGSSVVRGVI